MEQNPLAHSAFAAAADQPAVPATPVQTDDSGFETDAECNAYWQGVADGIRQSGGTVPPRLAARAARELLSPAQGNAQILPGTGRGTAREASGGGGPPLDATAPGREGALGHAHGTPPLHPGEDDPDDILAFTPAALRARHDGWTPEKQVAFVEALADTGVIRAAAGRVGMTPQSVSRLRRRREARGFDLACRTAETIGRRALVSIAYERAIEGTIRRHYFHGELKSEERVFNDRLLMALINRLPPEPVEAPELQAVEERWDDWMLAIGDGRDAPTPPPAPATSAAERADHEEGKVWMDEGTLLTNCPPPAGFDGESDFDYGHHLYQRTLTDAEADYWEEGGEAEAEEITTRFETVWHLDRETFFPWGSAPSAPLAEATEPEDAKSEAFAASGERIARPADGVAFR